MTKDTKAINLKLQLDLCDWVYFMAGLTTRNNATAYINQALRSDMENAAPEVKAAFDAYLRAKRVTE